MRSVLFLACVLVAFAQAACADLETSVEPASEALLARNPNSKKEIRYEKIALSAQSACGLAKDGTAYCWGLNNYGQLGIGTTELFTTRPRPVAGGHVFRDIEHSYTHGCGLVRDWRVFCWGSNEFGQLGAESPTISWSPIESAGGQTYSALAVGAWHTCGIRRDSAARLLDGLGFCWGWNAGGQLGIHEIGNAYSMPKQIFHFGPVFDVILEAFPPLHLYELVSAPFATCALSEGVTTGFFPRPTGRPGPWVCWGANQSGQFGNGSSGGTAIFPVHAMTSLGSVHVQRLGDTHFCVIGVQRPLQMNPQAFCMGSNDEGQLGTGNRTASTLPVPVVGGTAFRAVSSGTLHSCGLDASGAAFCWGANDLGQLGTGDTTPTTVPVRVATTLRFATIAAGNRFTCAITKQGDAYCWGRNEFGELGNGSTEAFRPLPTRVAEPEPGIQQ